MNSRILQILISITVLFSAAFFIKAGISHVQKKAFPLEQSENCFALEEIAPEGLDFTPQCYSFAGSIASSISLPALSTGRYFGDGVLSGILTNGKRPLYLLFKHLKIPFRA